MAKVSLRIYNREIEQLIEQGHTDEAIAHCRHILTTFPKHLETYRVLGKAYLESRRYSEVVDIFSRLLMAVPDDFVAHVGLSIIRDEENKLDDAIWHMERAFEAQPSNAAIQGELQRLYGRRDGMEPPKVRMTRGALARVYVQGELYPQAITEIRAVLAEDSQRTDMQVMLALSYFRSGQKSDASDLCNQLLKRYPYCYDANRIMVDLLPATTGTAESTQVYRMRIGELDPYANFARGSIFQAAEVPDASISLERLEYVPEQTEDQGWDSSAGIGLASGVALAAASAGEQPDWLKSGGFDSEAAPQNSLTSASSDLGIASSESQEEIPDFLRAAGWGTASGPEQPTSIFDDEPAAENDLVPADLPDWLKGQTPAASSEPISQPRPESIETPDWLSGLGGTESEASAFDAKQNETNLPDWLGGLDASETEQPIETPHSGPAQSADVPDWLSGLDGTEAEQPAETPDWLSGLGGAETEQPAQTFETSQDEIAQPADIPDWLKGAEPKSEPAASVESLGASAQEQDDAVAWLESLAAKHGAKPEELVTDPNKRSETPPEWVSQAQSIGEAQPKVEDLGASAQEQDDAVAWLESLAAKHGAKPEELVTDPSKRSETPPEWVAQAQSIGEAKPKVEDLGASAQEQDDAVAWLESLAAKHGAKPEELVTDPNKRSETPPEWVSQAQSIGEAQKSAPQEPAKTEWSEGAQNIGEQFFADFEEASTSAPTMDETGMWLRDLEEKEKQVEAGDIPAWMQPSAEEEKLERGEIPEWLNEPSQSVQQEPSQTPDLPNWLEGAEQEFVTDDTSLSAKVMGSQDLSDWLSGLDDEPGLNLDPEVLRAPQPQSAASQPDKNADKPELPGWLNDTEEEPSDEDEWKPASLPTSEPVSASQEQSVTLTADLPDWLQGVDEDAVTEQTEHAEDTPPWQHREQWEAEETAPQQPKPTSPSDWHPVVANVEKEKAAPQGRGQSLMQDPPSPEPVEKKKKEAPVRKQAVQKKPEAGQSGVGLLNQAKVELERGDIPEALLHYGKLIKKGKHLEETITHLSDSLYRYPVEVGIWQALGDAYMRANRLKEALDAYNKAEELIR
jgi:tetratricopeptide (TPR) repeat protein